MSEFLIQSFVTLLVIVNPFAVVAIFVMLTKNASVSTQRLVAKRSCLISLALLLIFAFVGDFLLSAMNISEAAFRITGGFLLLLSAIEMVRSNNDNDKHSLSECGELSRKQADDISVFPIAIPFVAGPGAITSTVILMRQAGEFGYIAELGLLAVVVSMIVITYCCLLCSDRIMKVLGVTGTNVLTRVFGIVLTAVCIQSIINGVIAASKLAN
jgi:multiple antibiotic resistance protein